VPVTEAQRGAIQAVLLAHEPPARHREAFATIAAHCSAAVPGPPTVAADPQLAAAVATLRERVAAAASNGTAPQAK
jgi:hypothetical protein